MKIKIKRIPHKIQKRAEEILELYTEGLVKARRSYGKKFLTLRVDRRYRLINRGREWELVSHSTYNGMIDKW